jgi:hypothetical protein
MKTWGSGDTTAFLTLTLVGSEWSASRPGRFTPGKSPQHPCNGSLGGSQRQYGSCGEEKHLYLAGNRTPAVQPVSRRPT